MSRGFRSRRFASWQVTLAVALAALGFLVAVQYRSEAPRVRYTSQERAPLIDTVRALQAQQEVLKRSVVAARAKLSELEGSSKGSAVLVAELNRRLADARLAAGLVALTGPGIIIRLEDSLFAPSIGENAADYTVSGQDIRAIVDELWLAGAEAVAVNGERLVSTSAIVELGTSILVNAAYLAPPYDIGAIGPADLYERLRRSASFAEFYRVRVQGYGLQIRVAERETPVIAAYAGTVALRNAVVDQSAGSTSAPSGGAPSSSPGPSTHSSP